MKIVENIKSIEENKRLLGEIINSHLDSLDLDDPQSQQKTLELCHVGKFLMLLSNEIQIDKLSEKPDFILNINSNKIGLEHQVLVDDKAKEREGFFENIFAAAESELKTDSELSNFLAVCYLKPFVNFKLNQKEYLIKIIKSVVREYILTNKLIDNPLIENIFKMPHSRKSIKVNLGPWWEKNVTEDLILKAIRKKENKISTYRENCGNTQWLIIVIGSNGESSFNMDKTLELNIKTEFDKVFVLEDFYNNLYELK